MAIILYQGNRNDELSLIRIRWSKAVNLFYSIFILAFASYYFLVRYEFFSPEWDYMISIVMSLSIYGIGYMAFTQPTIFNGIFLNQVFAVMGIYRNIPMFMTDDNNFTVFALPSRINYTTRQCCAHRLTHIGTDIYSAVESSVLYPFKGVLPQTKT